jgi:hypothetical protein
MVPDILDMCLITFTNWGSMSGFPKGYRLIQQVGGGGFSTCVRSQRQKKKEEKLDDVLLPGYFKPSIPRTIVLPPAKW